MAFTYAGQYTEALIATGATGAALLPSLPVNVFTVGTTTAATLYTSRTKGSTTANPVSTDADGNLTFFADPGQYDLVFTPLGGTQKRITVSVPQDPAEDAATYSPLSHNHNAPNVIGQLFTDTQTDASANLQAAIDAAAAANGDDIMLPRNVLYGSFKMRPRVSITGKGRGGTVLAALDGQSAPILDYATYDAFHTAVRKVRLEGNYRANRTSGVNATCRCVDMSSSSGDAYNNKVPNSGGSPDWPPDVFAGQVWDNPYNVLEDILVTNAGGDRAVYIGVNQRGTMVTRLVVEMARAVCLYVSCTDAHFHGMSLGTGGDGLVVTGAVNKFTNVKSWYNGVVAGYLTGSGDGVRIARPSGDPYGGNIFESLETQDNAGYGVRIANGRGNRVRGVSGGDSLGVVGLAIAIAADVVTSNDVEMELAKADRTTEAQAVTLDGGPGGTITFNRVMIRPDSTGESTTNPVRLLNSASLATNDVEVTQGDGFTDFGGSTGTKTPNMTAAVNKYTMTGALTIAAVATTQAWRKTMTIVITGNNANTVTWDASYGIPGNSTAAFSGTKTWTFRNAATTSATPSWLLVGSS